MRTPDYLINLVRKSAHRTPHLPPSVHTVCEEARCPNRGECFSHKTVTFLLLGKTCTRNCLYCSVEKGAVGHTPEQEIDDILESIQALGLRYVVLTSVTRDDLPDGGASHFAKVLSAIHHLDPTIKTEVLVPDFKGDTASIDTVCAQNPFVFNHNLELVETLFKTYRPKGNFNTSIDVLDYVATTYPDIYVKTGIMVGLGETADEVLAFIRMAHDHHWDCVTIGQYLKPSRQSAEVQRFVEPSEYDDYVRYGTELGIKVVAGPLVRSSYMAHSVFSN